MRSQQNIVFGVSAVALMSTIVFTVLQNFFGWYTPYPWVNTAALIVWVLLILGLFYAFQRLTFTRKEVMRRFYLSPEWMYNHEIGYAPLSRIVIDEPYDFVAFVGNALAKMSYGFEVAEAPEGFEPTLLISSRKFTFHYIDDVDETGDSGDKGVVIDKWSGSLQKIQTTADGNRTYISLGEYTNAMELAMLLDSNGAFDLQYGGNSPQENSGHKQ